jgi:hypothetical protein
MNVIFLDVDGVLNSEDFLRKREEEHRQLGHDGPAFPRRETKCDCFRIDRQIDPGAIAHLNDLVEETAAKIVISSSWRKLFDPPELHRILTAHGLVAEIIGETPDAPNDPDVQAAYGEADRIFRGHEIDFWLRQHPEVDRFVILDDGSDMAMHKNRHVQTDPQHGLISYDVELATRMMSWDGKSAPSPIEQMEHLAALLDDIPRYDGPFGSSAALHCNEVGCPETLLLTRTTMAQPSHDDDYQDLFPALDTAAVSLGWCLHQCVWWCPTHSAKKDFSDVSDVGGLQSAPKSLLDWGPDGLYDDTRASHLHGICHASSDGECSWRECPQRKTYQSHCPLDKGTPDE